MLAYAAVSASGVALNASVPAALKPKRAAQSATVVLLRRVWHSTRIACVCVSTRAAATTTTAATACNNRLMYQTRKKGGEGVVEGGEEKVKQKRENGQSLTHSLATER